MTSTWSCSGQSPCPARRSTSSSRPNILLYYDVFEQSLAAANIAAMLRPGGFLLSNDRIFELPGGPVALAGRTAAAYMNVPGSGPRGDQIYWYQRR